MSGPSRRAVLAALGWGTAGITALALGGCGLPALPPRNESTPDDAAAWISLRPEGHFELYSPRVEMGQGIAMGLRQLAAEELGVGVERVVCIQPDTAKLPVCRATVGSDSMRQYGPLVARAAAALALAMREHAAERLGVGTDTVSLGDDGARAPGGLALSLPELGQTGTIVVGARELDGAAPRSLAKGANRHTAGQPLATDAVRAVVTGKVALYADDIRLPGMLFGAMLRSDGLGGSISQIDDSACQDVPGYAGLVRGDGYAGVLAERRGALTEVLRRIRATDTYDPTVSDEMVARAIDVDAALADGGLEHTPVSRGAVGDANFDIDLRLDVPIAAHASIEPRTAVARFGDDGELEVWSGTQDAFFVRKTLATELGLAEERVRVHGMRIGGGFGARTLVIAELEAARLAHHSGRPVKVQWSRRDEFRAGFHRQPSSHRIRATADADGRITRWWHAFRAGHVIFTSAAMGPTLQFATSFVADPGTARGAIPPYAAPAVRVEFEDVRLPVHTGPWRGLGAGPNCWAIETAIDALARRHGRDPVEFPLANIAADQRRLAGALRRAAAMAGVPVEAIDETATIDSLGLESADAVILAMEAEEVLGREIEVGVFFQHDTIAAAVDALLGPPAADAAPDRS